MTNDKSIVEQYLSDTPVDAIAKAHNVSRRTVYDVLKRCGIARRRALHSLTAEQETAAAARYRAGERAAALAVEYRVDVVTLRTALKRQGVALRRYGRIAAVQEPQVAAACRSEGLRLADAAERFGVSTATIAAVLRRQDASPPVGRPPTCTLREDAFDEATPERDYWAGFLFADGCIIDDGQGQLTVKVGLARRDAAHLEKFRTFLGSDHSISYRAACISRGRPDGPFAHIAARTGPSAQFQVRSDRLAHALIALGMTRKNDDRCPVDALAESVDFWRGAIDGDGTIGVQKNKYQYATLSLCGHPALLERFAVFMKQHTSAELTIGPTSRYSHTQLDHATCHRVGTTGARARRAIELLYANSTVALDRKYARAIDIIGTPTAASHAGTARSAAADDVDGIVRVLQAGGFPYPPQLDDVARAQDLLRLKTVQTRLVDGAVQPRSLAGGKTCAPFFPNRYDAASRGSQSARAAWDDLTALRKAVEFQLRQGDPTVPARVLRAVTMQCRTPTIFRPAVARFIYDRYGRVGNGDVWDPCAGYGGRLLGAVAAGVHYIGTDVDEATVKGNRALARAVKSNAVVYQTPAEEFDPPPVDLVFTSPPYFDRERYSRGAEQSWRRHGASVDAWIAGFLRPVVERARGALSLGRHLVLNVADVRTADGVVPLVQLTIDTAVSAGFVLEERLLMPIAGMNRQNPTEPILVFRAV